MDLREGHRDRRVPPWTNCPTGRLADAKLKFHVGPAQAQALSTRKSCCPRNT